MGSGGIEGLAFFLAPRLASADARGLGEHIRQAQFTAAGARSISAGAASGRSPASDKRGGRDMLECSWSKVSRAIVGLSRAAGDLQDCG